MDIQKYNIQSESFLIRSILCLLSLTILLTSFTPHKIHAQTFTKITQGDIVNDGGDSRGCAWGDYNYDGYLDLYVSNFHNQNNFLYENNGDGTFAKITSGMPVSDGSSSYGSSWGDYDNDGDLDLFVANFGGENNLLYSNNGDNTFTEITTGIIVNDGGFSRSCSWGDYDNDGYLDVFVANGFGNNNFLYHNNGNGTFTKILTGDIVNDGGNSAVGIWADYDNDWDLDIFVSNAGGENNFLYSNNGDGLFTKITEGDIVNDVGNSSSASWGDYDNDLDSDLIVTNRVYPFNILYKNNSDGTFTKITTGIVVSDSGDFAGSSWGDFDNDGDLDLFIATRQYQNNVLYSNNGDGTFSKITGEIVVNDASWSIATGWCDYDNNGHLDLFVTNSNQNNFLYANNGNNNSWINIKCNGTSFTNNFAIGTRVKIKAVVNGNEVWQMQEISAQTGNRGQNSLNVEFGLGDAALIDSLLVEWPASDTTQILTNVAVNQFLTIQEPIVPLIISVFPDSGYRGLNVTTNITGKNTHFSDGNGTMDVWLSQGIDTIHAISFSDSNNTSLSADFNIPINIPTGIYQFSVETDMDGIMTWEEKFEILPEPPSMTVAPDSFDITLDEGDSTTQTLTIGNTGLGDLVWHISITAGSAYRLPGKIINLNISNLPRDNSPSQTGRGKIINKPIKSLNEVLANLNGIRIGFTNDFSYSSIISDLQARGAEIVNITFPTPDTTLANLDILAVDDAISSASLTQINSIRLWLHAGGGLLVQADNSNSMANVIELLTDAGIREISVGFSDAILTNILPHATTVNVDTINAASYGSFCTVIPPAETIIFDDMSRPHVAVSKQGQGRVVAAGNEITSDSNLGLGDTRLFGNQVFDWLARVAEFITVTPDSGVISPGGNQNVTVKFNGKNLTGGDYYATIQINSNDPFNNPMLIPTHLKVEPIVGIDDSFTGLIPEEYVLMQNFPNPFNPITHIRFGLPKPSDVKVELFDILGQRVSVLLGNKKRAGYHVIDFDGSQLSSGIYFYRIKAEEFIAVKKMVLMR